MKMPATRTVLVLIALVTGLGLMACSDEPVLHLDHQDVTESQLQRYLTDLREGEVRQDWRVLFPEMCSYLQGRDLGTQLTFLSNHPERPTIAIVNPSDVVILIGKDKPGQRGDPVSVARAVTILEKECDKIPFSERATLHTPVVHMPEIVEKPVCSFLDPAVPTPVTAPELARVHLPGLTMRSMTVHDSFVYASNDACLLVIDASDSRAPSVVASVPLSMGNHGGAFDLHHADGRLYAAVPYDGLRVFDVRDPANPIFISQADTSLQTQGLTMNFAHGVAVDGMNAFVSSTELKVFDLAGTNPREIASLLVYGYSGRLEYHAGHLYMPSHQVGYEGFQIVDVGDTAAPAVVGAIETGTSPGGRLDIDFAGTRAFVTAGDRLLVFDAANPAALQLIGEAELARTAQHVAVQDGIAVVSIAAEFPYGPSMFSGLQVWDVRGAQPVLLASHEMEAPPRINGKSIAVENNTVYVMAGSSLHLFDLDALRAGQP